MEAPRTILVYSGLDLVGDGLMKIPFLSALRAAWPAARVTWLSGRGKTVYAHALKPLVSAYIDEVIEDANIGAGVLELLRRPLSGRAFDLVIDTQRRGLTTLILRRIRHRVFVSGTGSYFFSDLKPADRHAKPAAMVDQMLALLSTASGRPAEPGPPPSLPAALNGIAQRLLPPGPVYVGFATGASLRHKCWPLDRFIALAQAVRARGWQPVFFMGPLERAELPLVRAAVPDALFPEEIAAEAGEAWQGPMLAIALAQRLAVAVANDSGVGHMFAAARAPLVSLFGPTSPEKFAPRTYPLRIVRARDFGGTEMERIPVAAVEETVRTLIAETGAAARRGAG